MVSCQEPSPLKGSKLSLQHHPHDAALVNSHSFVSMGVEARCRPCHSTVHCRHMKRQPSLCNCCPCHGHCHCNRRRRLRCCCHLHCRRHCHHPSPSPLLSPSAIAIAIAIANHRHRLCCIAISHRRCRCPHCWPLPSLSLLAIAVAISVGHHNCHCCRQLPTVVALAQKRIVFKQFKKIMLTLFHFVWTVGSTLMKAS